MKFIDNNSDLDTLNYMAKSVNPEILEKALNHSGLVQKEVTVTGKNGQIFTRKQWVRAGEEKSAPAHPQSKPKETHDKRETVPATPVNLTNKTKHLISISDVKELPEHIKSLNIPPDYRCVMISLEPNPKSEILAVGKDNQNRAHYIYTQAHWDRVNKEKYKRVTDLIQQRDDLLSFIDELRKTDEDTADCLDLIYNTGLRPGSDKDTSAKVQAYGASTLQGRHVVVEKEVINGQERDKVSLKFVGKKGVQQDHEIHDERLAKMLIQRKHQSGDNGKIFPSTNDVKLRTALKPMGIHPKDLRTMLANVTAQEWLSDVAPTADVKEFVKVRNAVGDAVCSKLGNQRTMSLKSYINPAVFEKWSPEGFKNWQKSQQKSA